MKKKLIILILLTTVVLYTGCSQNNTVPASQDELSVSLPEPADEAPAAKARTNNVVYPHNVEEIDSTHLRYKSNSEYHPYTVIFPNKFCSEDRSLIFDPDNGIYLTTEDGNASLQIEYISSEELTKESFVKYLTKKYGAYSTEQTENDIVFVKTMITDSHKNTVQSYMKARVEEGGYTQVILNCRESDSAVYDEILKNIEIN